MNTEALNHAVVFTKQWLAAMYEASELPGFAVAVSHQGTLLLNAAYGWADVERRIPLTPDHMFRVASHSKTFTATALMLLSEEGKLRLDDHVVDYLPWLKDHKDARWANVTLRQLLSHGAGVIRDGVDADYWQGLRPFPDADRFRREMMETDLVLDNNTTLKYSNYGYTLLGMVIEAISGQSYGQFVTERIVDPLGLARTFPDWDPTLEERVAPGLAVGYSRRLNKVRRPINHVGTQAMASATGFCSTAADLCAYFTAHMVGSGRLLSDESKKEMQRAAWRAKPPDPSTETEYGLGLIIQKVGERRVFGHSGGFLGFITNSKADPADQLVVVALTNCDGPAASIATGIYKVIDYFQQHTPSDLSSQHDTRRLEGHYLNEWGEGMLVSFGDKMVSANPLSWDPFAGAEVLEYVDDETFRVAQTSSFASEGELVRFYLKDGQVERISATGTSMWPKDVWLKRRSADN
jgi:D-alanyl-D-alanine carboxypeptidase